MEDHEALPKDVIPHNYRVHLTPNFETFLFDGEVAIELQIATETSSIVCHLFNYLNPHLTIKRRLPTRLN